MKKLIIFDLDGTLLDTSGGIIYCYRKTGEFLGLGKIRVPNEMCVIGGPLTAGFQTLYGSLPSDVLNAAVSTYKKLYGEHGIRKFAPYDGLEETLKLLKSSGYLLAVATLKLQKYAEIILKSAGIAEYFGAILGWDGESENSKAAIVTSALNAMGCAPDEAVLAGDSEYDRLGAQEAGVDFLGVSYGFGIKPEDSTQKAFPVVPTPRGIYDAVTQTM